jgi:Pyruvate/2-oxoacid:ferredoxin oxidoreductase gamma subunit
VRTENTVFLGCLSALEIFNVQEKDIRESISAVVSSKIMEQNLKAFESGKKSAHTFLRTLVPCKE